MKRTRPFGTFVLVPFLALAQVVFMESARAASPSELLRRGDLTVMTWNVYFGFDERPLLGASPEQIPGLVDQAWQAVHATDFRARAREIAKRIVATGPDLVALQEAARFEHLDVSSGSPEAVEIIDFVEILLSELEDAHRPYLVAAVSEEMDVTLPDAGGRFVRLLDREVILAAADRHGAPEIGISNPRHANFTNLLTICLVTDPANPEACLMPLTIKRGWASVDVAGWNGGFRFVTTHLEDVTPDAPPELQQLQLAQAAELLTVLPESPLETILVGDFNSDAQASWPAYAFLTGASPSGASLTDVWPIAWPNDPGLTWGQSPDLLNPFPTFTRRIDLVLLNGRFQVRDARLVGNRRGDRTPGGFWPSDHAGVVATLAP